MSFRDLTVAASLKRRDGAAGGRLPRPFRDLTVAASLKPMVIRQAFDGAVFFPRLNSRGLIEASLYSSSRSWHRALSAT